MRDYAELISDLRRHHCDAKEDDTQEVCEECAYDVIVADKSKFNGITDVCTCGLMHRAADAIEELLAERNKYKAYFDNVSSLPDCNVCLKQSVCEFVPAWGENTCINCPLALTEPPKEVE